MEITFHWHNLDTSDAIKDYATQKVEKIASHFNSLNSAVVRFKVEKLDNFVEFTINGDGVQFIATETNPDLYAAIDLLERKMERQVRRHKEKHLGKMHRHND